MKVLITGADGFVGKNLRVTLAERPNFEVLALTRTSTEEAIDSAVAMVDAVVHLAGVNRPQDPAEFESGNVVYTDRLCNALRETRRSVPILFASSIQADRDTPYGRSKRNAEERLFAHARETGSPVAIYRLPNVFGKWCRPNYNSAVATFCNNIARDLPIRIDDPSSRVQLVYIDDVIAELRRSLEAPPNGAEFRSVSPEYTSTVGELARQIQAFHDARTSLVTERVGDGLVRALYATYVSYLPPEAFSYGIQKHEDPRGMFVEMLKTKDSGQFSFFTAHPGVTRGGHYHHTKSEKFLVVRGRARFRFRHIVTGELVEFDTDAGTPTVVETIPGWAHDITNVGDGEMAVMLWANEIFDRERPDTIARKVNA